MYMTVAAILFVICIIGLTAGLTVLHSTDKQSSELLIPLFALGLVVSAIYSMGWAITIPTTLVAGLGILLGKHIVKKIEAKKQTIAG